MKMCQRKQSDKANSPAVSGLVKITVVLVFFLFAECAAGSCLSYGHACWGAHGKRSGHQKHLAEEIAKPNPKTKWFLSKLVQGPFEVRYVRDGEFDLLNSRQQPEEKFEENNNKNGINRNEDWDAVQDSITTNDRESVSEEANQSDNSLGKYFKSKFLDKRSVM